MIRRCDECAKSRIDELAMGILDQLKVEKPDYELINRWAEEIKNQCDVVIFDRSYDDKD